MARDIRVFRYDPAEGGSGHFDRFSLEIPNETTATILDVLLRLQEEQDPTLAFRYACRVNMCGSCGMVINGREALACKTNVSDIPAGKEITIRPLNHFPVIKDMVVDMRPFFDKYDSVLPFYEPRNGDSEPVRIRPDSEERLDIAGATECIACGCCVSSCTMAYHHAGYAGPAALNRAFTLLADSRDGLFAERLDRALESCYDCRTEFNCTEVCPKSISPTKAIKYIQRLAMLRPNIAANKPAAPAAKEPREPLDRRAVIAGLLGAGAAAALGVVGLGAAAGPAVPKTAKQWVAVAPLDHIKASGVTTVPMRYQINNGLYTQDVSAPVLVSRTGEDVVCFSATCPHLGCTVRWEEQSARFRCACHGGTFDRDGTVLAGPPPRPLDRYRFRVDAGQLLVEVG